MLMLAVGGMEAAALSAGLESGEHGTPMIFLPEAQKAILSSPVADMINSAPQSAGGGMGSAVGGYFIYAQIDDIPGIKWTHIDLGGPNKNFGVKGRSNGFGVGLMGTLALKMAQKNTIAPKL